METITLPESELVEMKQFYQEEYERLTRRLHHISTILGRLGVDAENPFSGIQKPKSYSAGDGVGALSVPAKRKRKPGRKSKWELLIMKRLRQLDKPVTYEELTDEIMAFSRLPENKRANTKQAIVNVIFRLRNRDKKLDTFSIGSKEKYIALKSWFDRPGEIKKSYASKINSSHLLEPAKASRRGRPPKNSQ